MSRPFRVAALKAAARRYDDAAIHTDARGKVEHSPHQHREALKAAFAEGYELASAEWAKLESADGVLAQPTGKTTDADGVQPSRGLALTDEQILDKASYHGFLGNREQLLKFVRGLGVTKPSDGVLASSNDQPKGCA